MVDLNKSAPPPLPTYHQADDEILLLDTPNSLSVMQAKTGLSMLGRLLGKVL